MTTLVDSEIEEHLEALHFAIDYVPKRAIRYFLDVSEEKISALIAEMESVLQSPEIYQEEGSRILYFGAMILASLHREEAAPLIRKIGQLDLELIEEFLGDRFFDSFPSAIAELYKYSLPELKTIIEDPEIDPSVRGACIQAMMILYGQKTMSRSEIVFYFKHLLEQRKEKIPYFYEVIAGTTFSLHPEELIELLRATFNEGFVDTDQIQLSEIEEVLALPKEQVIEESREMFASDLKDLIGHLELAFKGTEGPERNDPCPCGSGQKFKKCCR